MIMVILMRSHLLLQEKGDRNYRLTNGDVKLTSNTVTTLKFWNGRYPGIIFDSKYLKKLATDVFGLECLAESSVFGTRAQNANVQHGALDGTKLNFMRGNFLLFRDL